MKRSITYIALGISALFAGAPLMAQGANSLAGTPVGFIRFTVGEGSDTMFGLPLKQGVVHHGEVLLVAQSGGRTLIDVKGLGADTLEEGGAYYMRVRSGDLVGEYYLVADFSEGTLSVDSEGFDLLQMEGAEVEVVAAWTLDTLFPSSKMQEPGSPLVISGGKLPFQRGTQIFVYDNSVAGINLSAPYRFFLTAEGWLRQDAGFPASGSFVLHPDSFIVLRQPAGAGERSFVLAGMVETGALASMISSRADSKQDTMLSLARATDVTLSGLQMDSFEDSAGMLPFQRKDELFVLEQSRQGIDRAPLHRFFRVSGVWHFQATGYPVANDFLLKSGTPFIIRKAASEDAVQMWVHTTDE